MSHPARARPPVTTRLGVWAWLSVSACAGPWACSADVPSDLLDPEAIRELSMTQGSASGSARTGPWRFEFSDESCDCPTLSVEGEPLSLCELATLAPLEAELQELDGLLVVEFPAATLATLTGPIEADASFSVAGRHDATTLAGPLELLGRLDGRFFDADTRAEGSAGQRLIGELGGDAIDCRWSGDFVSARQ